MSRARRYARGLWPFFVGVGIALPLARWESGSWEVALLSCGLALTILVGLWAHIVARWS